MSVLQAKPMYGFSPNLRICLTQEYLGLIMFWGVSGNDCFNGNAFKTSL